MAKLTLFGYSPGNGLLHRCHPLAKLILLSLLSGAVFRGTWSGASAGLVLLLAAYPLSGVSLRRLGQALPFFLLTALLLFGSVPLLKAEDFSPGRTGLILGRLTDWLRLVFTLTAGILFAAVTTPGELRSAFAILLRPLPSRISEPVLLTVTFVFTLLPLTFSVLDQTRRAQEIRSAGRIRNPLRRITLLTVPFLAQLFLRVDRMSDAVVLRCSPEPFRPPVIPPVRVDILLFAAGFLLLRLVAL